MDAEMGGGYDHGTAAEPSMTSRRRRPGSPQALHALQVADARWQAVLATARDAIVAIDPEGRITLFNPAAEAVFGYGRDEVLGRNVTLLMPPPYRDEHDTYMRRYRETGEPRAIGRIRTVEGRRKDGEVFAMELSVSEARVDDEILYTAIIRDISARLSAEAELRDLQRAAAERARLADIGAITAKIVHDLGNPLAALSMQAQLILRRARRGDFAPVAPVEAPATQILHTLRRLEGLVGEFNDFARDQRLDLRRVPLAPLLASCADLWQALAAERGIVLAVAARGPLPALHVDEVLLRRVLDNLLKNAIEAVPTGAGEVVLSAAPTDDGGVCIAVDDNGSGIAAGLDVFRLFETTKPEGTGIGLAVARQLVEAHGGSITHHPRPQGGTRFAVVLPVAGPAQRTPDGSAAR